MKTIAQAALECTTSEMIQVAQNGMKNLSIIWGVFPHTQGEKWVSLDGAICAALNCESNTATRAAAQYVIEAN